MTLLMILMSWAQALQYPVSRLSATCFHKVASCSARDGASHVHSLHLGVSVRSWTSLLPRLPAWQEEKKDAGTSSLKVRVQLVISSEWSSASRDVSKHSDCLIINENINSEFTECSIGTDGVSQDAVCQWTPAPADAWKDQERSLPSWQRCQQ